MNTHNEFNPIKEVLYFIPAYKVYQMRNFPLFFVIQLAFLTSCSFITSESSTSQLYLDSNGITIKCEKCKVGQKGKVNEIEFEVVDNDLLRTRIKQGADLSKLCTSLVTDLSTDNDEGFFLNRDFNQNIANWDVSNVVTMKWMFINTAFNQPIGIWDVSYVKNMKGMFQNSPFNQPIANWNVSKVTDMSWMFSNSLFNQSINKWCVTSIKSEPEQFSMGSALSSQNKPKWGTCPN